MKITLICIGKVKEKFYRDAISEFEKRLSKYVPLTILELPDEKTPDHASEALNTQIKDKEGERILSKIREDDYVVALCIEGKKLDSPGLSDFLNQKGIEGTKNLVFIIGGSLGLSQDVIKRANYKLSFSDMTFPHQLMRVILLEQIYRGYRIMKNEPYHK